MTEAEWVDKVVLRMFERFAGDSAKQPTQAGQRPHGMKKGLGCGEAEKALDIKVLQDLGRKEGFRIELVAGPKEHEEFFLVAFPSGADRPLDHALRAVRHIEAGRPGLAIWEIRWVAHYEEHLEIPRYRFGSQAHMAKELEIARAQLAALTGEVREGSR